MKTIFTLFFSLLLTFAATAQHEGHQQENHQHKNHLDTLVSEYMEVKNALVKDDFDTAKNHFENFGEEVKSSSEMNEHERSEKHGMHHNAMVKAVDAASEAENIEALRSAFKDVSAELIKAVENQGYDEKLFVQYCSMEKSSWLSEEENIQNPFYGASMPTCGSVEKVIE